MADRRVEAIGDQSGRLARRQRDVEVMESARDSFAPRLEVGLLSGPGGEEPMHEIVAALRKRAQAGSLRWGEEPLGEPEMVHVALPLLEIDADRALPCDGDEGEVGRVGQVELETRPHSRPRIRERGLSLRSGPELELVRSASSVAGEDAAEGGVGDDEPPPVMLLEEATRPVPLLVGKHVPVGAGNGGRVQAHAPDVHGAAAERGRIARRGGSPRQGMISGHATR